MRIPFNIGPHQCEFSRSWATGSVRITVDGQPFQLQSALSVASVVDLKMTRAWDGTIDGQAVHIEKRRPLLFPSIRPHQYSIWVNGTLILSRSGF